jgi:hypothetical protein
VLSLFKIQRNHQTLLKPEASTLNDTTTTSTSFRSMLSFSYSFLITQFSSSFSMKTYGTLLLEGILKKFSQQNQVENVFLSQKSQVHRKGGNRLVFVYASQATFHQTSKKVGIHI